MADKYNLETALDQLDRCNVRVHETDKTILINERQPPGLRAWGAIDYLRTKHGFGTERL